MGTANYATFRARSSMWGRIHWHGPRNSHTVALTFDDGPTSPFTESILDILRDERIRATFFVIGKHAEEHPDLVRRMHEEGHTIGNHSYLHPHYGFIRGPRFWQDQIRRCDEVIESLIGIRPAYFRPPLGAKNCFTLHAARQRNQKVVNWSRRAFDGLRTTSQLILQRLADARAGDILLLHDGVGPGHPALDLSPTVAALRPLIRRLREKNLEPIGLDRLLDPIPGSQGALAPLNS